jgi:uncharacterized protein
MTQMATEQARLAVRIKPNSARDQVMGFKDSAWQIRIAAPPVEGKANEKLIEFLSEVLKVRKSAISIEKGHTSRNKRLTVDGVSHAMLQSLMAEACTD